MTHLKYLLLVVCMCVFSNIQSQDFTKKERKVNIFTPEEKDNLQMWFHNEIHKMEFTEEELDNYYAVIFYYVAKIARLDDLDKGYTKEELKIEVNKLIALQNRDLQKLLTEERYKLHTEIYAVFLRAAYTRWGINE